MGYRFYTGLKEATIPQMTTTENAAPAYQESGSALVDLFGLGGALRMRDVDARVALFNRAYREDKLLATKMLFYLRDIRGGQGERDTFRILFSPHSAIDEEVIRKNFHLIPEYGRWDDLIELYFAVWLDERYKALADEIYLLLKSQWKIDLAAMEEGKSISLLAKWIPSENASSSISRSQSKVLRKSIGECSSKTWRKQLGTLRNRIDIVERKMSERKWESINYEHVPSRAMLLYRKAFMAHDGSRFQAYQDQVSSGEKKVNAATLYPYDIIDKFVTVMEAMSSFSRNERIPRILEIYGFSANDLQALDNQWRSLPDWVAGDDGDTLVLCDTSGSMFDRNYSISKSVSLAIYMAERNSGAFSNRFLTFESHPHIQFIHPNEDIAHKALRTASAPWGGSTDLNLAFESILRFAKENEVSAEDMPSRIIIVSDMQFDMAVRTRFTPRSLFPSSSTERDTNLNVMRRQYAAAGYEMPEVVFWNVNARHTQTPATFNEDGIMMVSGCSPSVFEMVVSGEVQTPYDLMLKTLNQPRYDRITV